jgi:hypothetical protein
MPKRDNERTIDLPTGIARATTYTTVAGGTIAIHDHQSGSGGGILTGYATTIHEHAATAITSGVLAPARGGTGVDNGTYLLTVPATGTAVLLDATQTLTNKTLTTPTIASFTNAGHNHADAAGGGQLSLTTAVTGILPSANGGTGINNGGRTLTIATNSGTLAFSAASSTLTVPATGTAALLATAQTFTALKTFSSGINLGGTTLSDYLTGTWTPAYVPASGAFTTINYSEQTGRYARIGNLCWVGGRIATNNTAGFDPTGASGALTISGLPFATVQASVNYTRARRFGSGGASGPLFTQIVTGTPTSIDLVFNSDITISVPVALTVAQMDITTGTFRNDVFFSIWYRIA